MPVRGQGLWRLFPAVRKAERPRFVFFFTLATLITLAQTLGLAGAEALFLARIGVEFLPHTFILAAGGSVVGLLLYATVVGAVRNNLLFSRMLWLAALALGAGAFVASSGSRAILPVLLGAFFLTQALFLNHFWTFASDYFDILASKRLSPLFAFGASAGGALGGGLAVALIRFAPPEALVGVWALLLLVSGIFVRTRRRALLHWGLVELVEKDETSLAGLGMATRYLRRSRLGRTLVVAAVGMTLALIVSQYLYSSIFVAAYPTAEALAVFFGAYLALSHVGELVVGFVITPWLIRRIGVVGANVVHPLTTLCAFAALAVEPGLSAAVLARVNRDLLEDSLASPVRHLTYNAIPPRFRGRLRAFIEGIVVYAAMGLAGAALLVQHAVPPAWLLAFGGVMATVYVLATLQIRREYLHTLVGGIREGRLDLADLEAQLGTWETSRLIDAWTGVLAGGGPRAVRTAGQLAPLLAARGITAPLEDAAAHPEPQVRVACFEALRRSRAGVPEAVLLNAIADPDPEIRRLAVRVLGGSDPESGAEAETLAGPTAAPRILAAPQPSFSAEIRTLIGDRDPRVRAEAALIMGKEGHETVAAMARSDDPDVAAAALACLPEELAELACLRAEDDDPGVRAAALEAAARLVGSVSVRRDRLVRDLSHPDHRVRGGAVSALAASALAEAASLRVVAGALSDPSREVRARAVEGLQRRGEEGVEAAVPHLRSESEGGAEAAIAVVGSRLTDETRRLLVDELRRRVRQAWGDLLALHVLPRQTGMASRFLCAAHQDSVLRNQRLAFTLLRTLEDPSVVRSVERALRLGSPKARAEALEVLANLGDREAANLLVLLLEDSPLTEKVRHASADVAGLQDVDSAVDADRRALDMWIRLGADYYRKEGGEDLSQRETMERLLLLREVPLFSRLSLHQVEAINSIMRESSYLAGEVVFREGDPGGELYLLLEGKARIVKDHGTPDELILGRMEAPGYFGEMAALDDRPRSATVVFSDDARVLALNGDSFKDLMLQMPEIALEVCRELSERVRTLDAQMGRGAQHPVVAGAAPGL